VAGVVRAETNPGRTVGATVSSGTSVDGDIVGGLVGDVVGSAVGDNVASEISADGDNVWDVVGLEEDGGMLSSGMSSIVGSNDVGELVVIVGPRVGVCVVGTMVVGVMVVGTKVVGVMVVGTKVVGERVVGRSVVGMSGGMTVVGIKEGITTGVITGLEVGDDEAVAQGSVTSMRPA